MLPENLPFRVIRVNSEDEVLARANNLIVGWAAYETARRMYPKDRIDYRPGARVIEKSEPGTGLAYSSRYLASSTEHTCLATCRCCCRIAITGCDLDGFEINESPVGVNRF
jgi:hypothetical protein